MIELLVMGGGLLALGAAPIWQARRRLRRWQIVLPSIVLLATIPLAIPVVRDIREHAGGDAAAWGRLAELVVLMGLVPLMLIATGALIAGVFALGIYGWGRGRPQVKVRQEPWYAALFRPRTRSETLMRLYVSLGSMVVVGILWVLGVRPGA